MITIIGAPEMVTNPAFETSCICVYYFVREIIISKFEYTYTVVLFCFTDHLGEIKYNEVSNTTLKLNCV